MVNFQGDAVNVNPAVNNELIAMIERTGCDIATVGMLFDKAGDVKVPSNVKIVMGLREGEDEGRCRISRGRKFPLSATRKAAKIRIFIIISVFTFTGRNR